MSPPDSPRPASSSDNTQWTLRLGYRTIGGQDWSHGLQLQVGPTFRLGDHVRLGLQLETSTMFLFSERDPRTLSANAVIGQNFDGVTARRRDGTVYTDVTGGTQFQNNAFLLQLVPEVQLMFRPSRAFPFEAGIRFGGGMTYTTVHTRTVVNRADPTAGHADPGGCIPGDVHSSEGCIPEPSAGPGGGPYETDAGAWNFWVRFGPRVVVTPHEAFQLSTELLFQSNATTGAFDLVWRSGVRLGLPIGDHFMLMAEPRYVLRSVEGAPVQHGFDLFAGAQARW